MDSSNFETQEREMLFIAVLRSTYIPKANFKILVTAGGVSDLKTSSIVRRGWSWWYACLTFFDMLVMCGGWIDPQLVAILNPICRFRHLFCSSRPGTPES